MKSSTEAPVKILLVEDHAVLRALLRDIIDLEYPEWQIYEAENGQEGLRLAQQVHPDLIFVDYQMPLMNGYELVMALKRHPATRAIPLILSTGSEIEESEVNELYSLCERSVTKPYDFMEIIDVLAALEQSRAAPPVPSEPAQVVSQESYPTFSFFRETPVLA